MSQEDRTTEELANAEVVPELSGPEQMYLRFGEEDYGFVSKTERNEILVETDLINEAEDTLSFFGTDGEENITFDADFESDEYVITVDGDERVVPNELESDALSAVRERDGEALGEIHQHVVDTQVRQSVVNEFHSEFIDEVEMKMLATQDGEGEYEDVEHERNPRVEVTDDGWIVDDTFIVQWNAENYLTTDIQVHIRDGERTVEADESKQARNLSFSAIDGEKEVDSPTGITFTLDEREQKFLATVEILLNPYQFLEEDEAHDLVDMNNLNENTLTAIAASAQCNGFTDETDGLHHGHSMQKHSIQDLNVTDEVADLLDHRHNGHSALHEMWARREEFQNRNDITVFEDASNINGQKWEKIRQTREKAPIPADVQRDIQDTYGTAYQL
jgi:hypothetical protein